MRSFFRTLALVAASLFAYSQAQAQTVSVTADLKSMFAGNQTTKAQVCFSLVDGAGQQLNDPRVVGSGVILPTANQCVLPNGSGHVATTLYANDQVSPAGSHYSIQYLFNGRQVHGDTFTFLLADGTENLNTKAPDTTIAIVPAPTGDTTYARLDGGNTPFTGGITAPTITTPSASISTITSNSNFTGLPNFAAVTHTGLASFGSASPATFSGFPTLSPKFLTSLSNGATNYYTTPDLYFSRVDTTAYATGAGQCFNGPLTSCDAPILHIDMSNQTTGNIPGMIGVEVFGWGFKANGATPSAFSNYEVGFGANMQDAAVANITNLRGANLDVLVNGLPTTAGPGGFTRSAVTLEGDANNNSGVDAIATVGNGAGNYIAGVTMIANGLNSLSAAFVANSSVTISGKGWRCGYCAAGITDVAFGEYIGGTGSFSPIYGFAAHAANSGAGFVAGSGTTVTTQGTVGNPSIAFLADANGITGNVETVNSLPIAFTAKNGSSSGTQWQVQHVAGSGMRWTLIGTASFFNMKNTGAFAFVGTKGQHFESQAANNDLDGVLAVSASTSGSVTFTTPYTSAPSCTLSPTGDPTIVGVWWVTTSTTTVTANIKVSGTINFMYHCIGNPN